MADPSANRRGVFLMLGAMACYVLNDACLKFTLAHHPHGQVLAVRGLFATAMVLVLARRAGMLPRWRQLLQPMVAVRSVLEVATAMASVAALSLTPLSIVTAIMMVSPLLIAVCAMALGWEAPQAGRIFATVTGLAGVLLIARPFSQASVANWGIVFSLACAAGLAARDLATRAMPPGVPSVLITLAATVASCAGGFALGLRETWQPLQPAQTLGLALAALCAALGNYALIAACRDVDLSVVAPFRYSILLWALLMGYLGWDETPDAASGIGIVLISAGGLLALRGSRSR
ncbi:DMT family transporter [Variovorax sp. LjRoot84]|uniref:DMT family transporter n=1 Tax=unclassified Variovorax TaxID=663243 RepID=UPI00088A4092|nr:DMT family transporter [Variovorax sp. CF079]SDD87763.1 Permease of the drug/metabolite transporter (DMT) superfamily [Variovorax sp. CF079]